MTKDKYDVIIIGAGIGGLTCGCYLAKAGLKVLIVEKHHQVGGYCTSFKRKGFTFDASVHYIGGGREKGEIGKLRASFGLDKFIKLKKIDPFDNIIFPDFNFVVRNKVSGTKRNLKKIFVQEKESIDKFFRFLQCEDYFYLFGSLRNRTFDDLLNDFFKDNKIKAALSALLGNIGLSAEELSALSAVALYREFILDGGYYPVGGNQAYSNALLRIFHNLGGVSLLSNEVKKIIIKKSVAGGILLANKMKISSKIVVSNIDATTTFKKLLNCNKKEILSKLSKLEFSPSAFSVYLGLNKDISKILKEKCVTWYFKTYELFNCYGRIDNVIKDKNLRYIVCSFPSLHDSSLAPEGKSTMELFALAPFKTRNFWDNNKENVAAKMIKIAEAIIPDLSKFIEVKEIATPYTFYRYTGNSNGAIYGWASYPNQIDRTIMPNKAYLPGLYMVGHWTTNGFGQGGIASVTYSGRNAAEQILNEFKK